MALLGILFGAAVHRRAGWGTPTATRRKFKREDRDGIYYGGYPFISLLGTVLILAMRVSHLSYMYFSIVPGGIWSAHFMLNYIHY